ncbi:MAG: cytochrome c [Betaproteobacteria bacterium]|nr:cytochrome c [Betaproteobacteria bacterium]
MTKTTKVAVLLAVSGLMAAAGASAADYEAGKKKAGEVCAACHGPNGDKSMTPDIPILAGQRFDYLKAALNQYKKKERTNPMMMPMAEPLTKQDIENVAYFFSKQAGLKVKY